MAGTILFNVKQSDGYVKVTSGDASGSIFHINGGRLYLTQSDAVPGIDTPPMCELNSQNRDYIFLNLGEENIYAYAVDNAVEFSVTPGAIGSGVSEAKVKQLIQEAMSRGYSTDYNWPDDALIEIVKTRDSDGKLSPEATSPFFVQGGQTGTTPYCIFDAKSELQTGEYVISFDASLGAGSGSGDSATGRYIYCGVVKDGTAGSRPSMSDINTKYTKIGKIDTTFTTRLELTVLVANGGTDATKVSKIFFRGIGAIGEIAAISPANTGMDGIDFLNGGCLDFIVDGNATANCVLSNFNYIFHAK